MDCVTLEKKIVKFLIRLFRGKSQLELDTIHFSFVTIKFDFTSMTYLYFKIDLKPW